MEKRKPLIQIIKQILLLLLYFFIPTLLVTIPFIRNNILGNNSFLYTISNLIVYLTILVVFVLIFRKKLFQDFKDFKKNGRKYLRKNYEYWIYGLLIMIFTNAIISIFMGLPANEESVQDLLKNFPYFYIILAIIIAPITEELLTRELLKDTFKNPIIYYILSGLIFGLLHVITALESGNYLELLYVIPYGTLGAYFAKIYQNTNNIWSNIFFHSFHNTFATVISLIFGGFII